MANHTIPRKPGTVGHVSDVRFMEVEFSAPVGTRMVIELTGGLRLLVADDRAVETAAKFIHFLNQQSYGASACDGRPRCRPQKGGRS